MVINIDGRRLLSRRVANDEAELSGLIGEITVLADQVTWAIDLAGGGAALLIALLFETDQRLIYIPGRTVNGAGGGCRSEGKTDARDAAIITDRARMRRDLAPLRGEDELIVELAPLVARRRQRIADRTRMINPLYEHLLAVCPALQVTNNGPLVLLTGYPTTSTTRRMGAARVEPWLRKQGVRNAASLAAHLVAQLTEGVMTLD